MYQTQQNQTLETNQLTNQTQNVINFNAIPQTNQPNIVPNINNTPQNIQNFNPQNNPQNNNQFNPTFNPTINPVFQNSFYWPYKSRSRTQKNEMSFLRSRDYDSDFKINKY